MRTKFEEGTDINGEFRVSWERECIDETDV